jgi:hypothetical protein
MRSRTNSWLIMLTDGATGFFPLATVHICLKATYVDGGKESVNGLYIQNVDYNGVCALKVDMDYIRYSCLSK